MNYGFITWKSHYTHFFHYWIGRFHLNWNTSKSGCTTESIPPLFCSLIVFQWMTCEYPSNTRSHYTVFRDFPATLSVVTNAGGYLVSISSSKSSSNPLSVPFFLFWEQKQRHFCKQSWRIQQRQLMHDSKISTTTTAMTTIAAKVMRPSFASQQSRKSVSQHWSSHHFELTRWKNQKHRLSL